MKHYCPVCGKQVVPYDVDCNDEYITTAIGGKRGIGSEIYCGYCSSELDEDGLFPEERAKLIGEVDNENS